MKTHFRNILPVLALILPATAHAQTPDARVMSGPMAIRADSALSSIVPRGFSGVALVAKNGEVILSKGYGLANRATKSPMATGSIIQIGSNTKDFTIVSVLQLIERGKLGLDDSIAHYFSNVPADKRVITIRQLLFHRAGFDQHLGGDWEVITRGDEIRKALASPLLFEAGTDRKYSNIGYSLLAAIIEMVSHQSYDEYVRDNILTPLGMHETGLLLPHFDTMRVAHGYRDGNDAGTFLQRAHAPDGPWWNLRGNGGMLSTVSDMYRFYRALMSDGPLLKPATRDIFFHPNEPSVLAGSDLTYFFFYSRYPGAGIDAFLVSNATDFPAPLARDLMVSALGIASRGPQGGGGPGAPGMQISMDTTRGPRGGGASVGAPGATPSGAIAGSKRDAAGLDAPVAIPDTHAAAAMKAYLQVYQDADPARIKDFLQNRVIRAPGDTRTIEERMAVYKSMHDDMGFLTPVEVVESTPTLLTVRMRAALGGFATFSFHVEESAPYRLTGLQVERD